MDFCESLTLITQSKLRATSEVAVWNPVSGSDCFLFVRGLGEKGQGLSPKEESFSRTSCRVFDFAQRPNQIRSSKLQAKY